MPSTPTAPTSFLQVSSRTGSKQKALARSLQRLVEGGGPHVASYKLMLLATRSKTFEKNPFEHISGLIDNMIRLLKQEQADDDKQKGFCDAEIQKAGEDKSATQDNIKSLEASMAETNELIETAESEIA